MDNKVYVMNDKRYKQIEIECSRMAQERTVQFLMPKQKKQSTNSIQKIFYMPIFQQHRYWKMQKKTTWIYFTCVRCMMIEWKVRYKTLAQASAFSIA